jgi:hypothetical protein
MSSDKEIEKEYRFESCVLSSTIIGYCLSFLENGKVVQILQKIKEFLTSEMIYRAYGAIEVQKALQQ